MIIGIVKIHVYIYSPYCVCENIYIVTCVSNRTLYASSQYFYYPDEETELFETGRSLFYSGVDV